MTRVITWHTIETLLARTVEVGDCHEWLGYTANRCPQVSHGGKMVTVRRLIQELQGKSVAGYYLSTSCGNSLCIAPEHAAVRTSVAHFKKMNASVDPNGTLRIIKLQQAARWRRKLTDEQVSQIRLDPRPSRAVAADYGVSRGLVCLIRRGLSHRPIIANPFAGLMK